MSRMTRSQDTGSGADIKGDVLDTFNKTFHAKMDWLTGRVGIARHRD